jgi:hypothetical protein
MRPPPLTPADCPVLRAGLAAKPAHPGYLLYDEYGICKFTVQLVPKGLEILQACNGYRSVATICAHLRVPVGNALDLLNQLNAGLMLDTPYYRATLHGRLDPVRQSVCFHPKMPVATLRQQLDELFTASGGLGVPGPARPHDGPPLRAVLVPHMDYARGGVCYGWGFKELAERTDARLFVIIATSHYAGRTRFSLSRQDFRTPLGTTPTDQVYVERLAAHYGPDVFGDPLAHWNEHSIELEVVLLQYLFAERGPIRIVPLLVGSFADRVETQTVPAGQADIARMVQALRAAEAEAGEPICYIISGDLAHIGPKFDDPRLLDDNYLRASAAQDQRLLQAATAVDADGYFSVIAAENDARNICGFPPTYTTLHACQPTQGRLLHYAQYVDPKGYESVSFASMAFYGAAR